MDFELADDHRMLKDLVARFVKTELMPLEAGVLAREARGEGLHLAPEERARADKVSREMGLWGLDAPSEMGGHDLPAAALVGVNEEMGRTVAPYTLPPDSPNLRMLMAVCDPRQSEAYLVPYARGERVSAIAISEPGAGSDPAAMTTRAERRGDDYVLNGRKIWISRAAEADFTIVMAATSQTEEEGSRRGRAAVTAFVVEKGDKGFLVERRIPMIGGAVTYEVAFEDCVVPLWRRLGAEGEGFAPMQLRLGVRRMQMAAWCIGMAERALEMMTAHARLRRTFGAALADRQAVQWWIADAATRIHACRLMAYDCALKLDKGRDVRREISMIKVYATELAWETTDRAMQVFGAMGMAKETPLPLMHDQARTMRIYDGPSEVHRWVVARDVLGRGR
jgi:acyl-CoA dehydrogenase